MEKVKLDHPTEESITFEFQGKKICVNPYISVEIKVALLQEYINNLFENPDIDLVGRYLTSEYSLMLQILDFFTNIDVNSIELSDMLNNGVWKKTIVYLSWYAGFRKDLEKILELRHNQIQIEKSIGSVLDDFLSKLMEVLNNIPELDVAALQAASKEFTQELKKLNKQFPGILSGSDSQN